MLKNPGFLFKILYFLDFFFYFSRSRFFFCLNCKFQVFSCFSRFAGKVATLLLSHLHIKQLIRINGSTKTFHCEIKFIYNLQFWLFQLQVNIHIDKRSAAYYTSQANFLRKNTLEPHFVRRKSLLGHSYLKQLSLS